MFIMPLKNRHATSEHLQCQSFFFLSVGLLLIAAGLINAQTNVTQYADVSIGSNDGMVPAAQVPFGMLQIGPDGPANAFNHRYHYTVLTINDFSLTQINGAGACAKGHVQFKPTTGSLSASPGPNWNDYDSPYEHNTETMAPGFYGVTLSRYDVKVEITATSRTGIVRMTYPSTTQANVLFNVVRSNVYGRNGAEYMEHGGSITIVGDDQVTGMSNAAAANVSSETYPIYFAAQFDHLFTGYGTFKGETISDGNRSDSGAQAGGYVTFDATSNDVVLMKIAISYASLANAQENLSEISGWDIAAVRAEADSSWNKILGRVQVTGGNDENMRKFYGALYRCYLHPNMASDINGEYMGFDDAVHNANDFTVYQTYSGWDIFRSWIQMVSIFAPQTLDFVKSMMVDGQQGKAMPQWSDQNKELYIMVGDPSATMVATAYAFGVRGFDYQEALKLMDEGATVSSRSIRSNVTEYNRLHYLPGNAAITQDYAGVDFAISQFAGSIGDTEKFMTYRPRSQWWKNNFNTSTGYLQAKNSNGSWRTPWSPTTTDGYIENNATVYTWLVPYNLEALFELAGGIDAVIPRLDEFFTNLNGPWNEPYLQMGNEPSFSQPWIYNSVMQPWKTQSVVRRIIEEQFTTEPWGYPGDDDLGSMSSWLVWAYLGMYPAYPGMDIMVLNGPYFPSITLNLPNGNTVQINAEGAGPDAPYIQSLKVNGVSTTKTWLHWRDIANNGTLDYVMGSSPNENWGSNPDDVPPSYDTDFVVGVEPNRPWLADDCDNKLTFKAVYKSSTPGVIMLECNAPQGTVTNIRLDMYNLAGRHVLVHETANKPESVNGRIVWNLQPLFIDGAIGNGIYFVRIRFQIKGEKQLRTAIHKIMLQ